MDFFPQLRERMDLWHTEERYQRIGDVVVKFSPFFKMYTEYVKNFDNAIHTINTTYAKNAKFAAIMDEIHVRISQPNRICLQVFPAFLKSIRQMLTSGIFSIWTRLQFHFRFHF